MRILTEDIIAELKLRLSETKSLRSKVLLKEALRALTELKAANKKKP